MSLAIRSLIIALLLTQQASAESTQQLRQRAIEYVNSHSQQCTLGDGYRCAPVTESQLLLNPQATVPALYLQAWPAAYADFKRLAELSEEQKDLRHYTIGFAEQGDRYLVVFNALLLPEIDPAGMATGRLLRSTLGRSMRYEIDQQSLKIISRKFYR